MIYIVTDGDNHYSEGRTLEDAFANFKSEVLDEVNQEDLFVYEAEQIQVEFKIIKRSVPVKAPK